MRSNFFKSDDTSYHVSEYYFRVEFQQRGAPHVYALLWLKNKNNEDAPTCWSKEGTDDFKLTSCLQCADLKEKNNQVSNTLPQRDM